MKNNKFINIWLLVFEIEIFVNTKIGNCLLNKTILRGKLKLGMCPERENKSKNQIIAV